MNMIHPLRIKDCPHCTGLRLFHVGKFEIWQCQFGCGRITFEWYNERKQLQAKLAAKKDRIAELEKLMREAIENCEVCRGSIECARCESFDVALKAHV